MSIILHTAACDMRLTKHLCHASCVVQHANHLLAVLLAALLGRGGCVALMGLCSPALPFAVSLGVPSVVALLVPVAVAS